MEDRWKPHHLTRGQLEERRLEAAQHIKAGHTRKQLQAHFAVSTNTIDLWINRLKVDGEDALKATVSSGRPRKLTSEQLDQLVELLRQGAPAHHHAHDQWTTRRIRDLIGNTFGIWYHVDHVRKLLHGLGWSYQKPEKRAVERSEEAIKQWIEVTYPDLAKKLPHEGPPSCLPTSVVPA